MALGVKESKEKYAEYIKFARHIEEELRAVGYRVDVEDDIELGATLIISHEDKRIADLTWNVPYYLTFTPRVDVGEEGFDIDYVKNLDDWREFLSEVYSALKGYINRSDLKSHQ